MPSLRAAHALTRLTRLVLAWFSLALLVAMASPLIKPQSIELICSGAGMMKLLVKSDDGSSAPSSSHTLDCPLCASHTAPPPALLSWDAQPQPLGHVLQSIPAARIAALTAAPLPPRGPPEHS